MRLLSQIRFALARRPWVYWTFVACCAAIVWSAVSSSQARLDNERRQWGETRSVWVAATDISPGQPIRSVARDYPSAMVPRSAVTAEPRGVTARSPISQGEVLVEADVAATANDAVPTDWVAFALSDTDAPTLARGDAILLFGSGERLCAGLVIEAGIDPIEVAVPESCADSVSVQVVLGQLVLGLTSR